MYDSISILYTSGDFKRAGECSSRMRTNLLRLGVEPEKVRRLAISSYEAEMNMVIFSRGGKIIVRVLPKKIIIEAFDKGPGIPDIEKALTPGFSTAPDWVRNMGFGAGMGLPNIKNLSDEMEIKTQVGEYTNLKFAICDHNSTENSLPVIELGNKNNILVLPGMEITTKEEVHILSIFGNLESAFSFQNVEKIHFLKQSAEETGGFLEIESQKGKGTKISAFFHRDHIDMKPLGDIKKTIKILTLTNPEINIDLKFEDY